MYGIYLHIIMFRHYSSWVTPVKFLTPLKRLAVPHGMFYVEVGFNNSHVTMHRYVT